MMILLPRLCLLALVAVSLLTLVSCNEDDGTSSGSKPTISSINPAQVFPGQTNVRATIVGTNFTGFGAVNMGPGIEILKTKLISNTEISIRFTVEPNAAPGPRTISVSTLAGTGELNGRRCSGHTAADDNGVVGHQQSSGMIRGIRASFQQSAEAAKQKLTAYQFV